MLVSCPKVSLLWPEAEEWDWWGTDAPEKSTSVGKATQRLSECMAGVCKGTVGFVWGVEAEYDAELEAIGAAGEGLRGWEGLKVGVMVAAGVGIRGGGSDGISGVA